MLSKLARSLPARLADSVMHHALLECLLLTNVLRRALHAEGRNRQLTSRCITIVAVLLDFVRSQAPVAAVTWPWALLTIIKRDRYASESPLRKFATVFSQSKNHYGRQMWYQNDQKSVKFNVAVIVC